MIYAYCTQCRIRIDRCTNAGSHRAANRILWVVDLILGGRGGQRIRERKFVTKELAEARERELQVDYQRGELNLKKDDNIRFHFIVDKYYSEHCLVFNRNPERSTKYRLENIKTFIGNPLIKNIHRQTLKDLQAKMSLEMEASTVNRQFNIIKAIFYKAIEWGFIKDNPAEFITRLPENDPIPRFLDKQEIDQLMRSIKDQNLRDYATILLHTGARPSSIKMVSWDNNDVDMVSKSIWFTTFKGRRKYRYAHPIDDTLYEILIRRASITGKKGLVFDYTNLRKLTEQAIKESKLNACKQPNQFFTIYGLRHCYASHLLMSGASLDEVRRLLGHTDMKMLMKHYGHLTQDYLRKVQSKINLTAYPIELKEAI